MFFFYAIIFLLSIRPNLCCVKFEQSAQFNEKCIRAADVMLIIDTSNRIDQNEFDNMRLSLINFIESLEIADDKINLAILVFSDRIKFLQPFTSNKFDKIIIKNKINDLKQSIDASLTTRALNFAKLSLQLSNRNQKIPRIAILFSNGAFQDNEIRFVRKESNFLKNAAQFITVGIGKGSKSNSLKMLASCPNYFIQFDMLKLLVKSISGLNCS